MQYTLITKQGRIYVFFLQTVAAQFQQAYGGVVVSQQLLADADLPENGSCATI
jgi:acyl-CoA thioesterase